MKQQKLFIFYRDRDYIFSGIFFVFYIKLLSFDRFFSNGAFPIFSINSAFESGQEVLGNVVDNLDATEDGEACEESHGATDQADQTFDCHLHISFNLTNRKVRK